MSSVNASESGSRSFRDQGVTPEGPAPDPGPGPPDPLLRRIARKVGSRGLLIAGVLAALAVRIPLLPLVSSDMTEALTRWYDFIAENGGFAAFRFDFGDYNVPYLYLLALATFTASWLC